MKLTQDFFNKFKGNIKNNVNLSNYNWFNLGGPAEYLFKPENKEQLIEFLRETKIFKLNTTVLGAGSNTLIRDNGIKGAVIKLGSSFSKIKLINSDTLEVGAAALDRKVSNYAKDNGLSEFEFLSCIPGSIGGAVIMNSGCYGDDISKILISINVIDIKDCKEKVIKRQDLKFFYRGTNLPLEYIIVSAKLKGKIKSKSTIDEKQNNFIKKKKLSQPSQIKTCGSTFKNLSNQKKAWQVIKQTGCDKFREGDAVISEKHCNFFVNNGNAKSADIENLINKVKKTVNDKAGVNLELEIKIIVI